MSSARVFLLLALVGAGVLACGEQGPTSPASPARAPAAARAARSETTLVPFKGAAEFTSVITDDVPQCQPFPTERGVRDEFVGTATQLGRFTFSATHCGQPYLATPDQRFYYRGEGTFTAANGDHLFVTYTGTIFLTAGAPVATFEEPMTITGGTGRFAGATGSFTVTGTFELGPRVGTAIMRGSISSPGGHA